MTLAPAAPRLAALPAFAERLIGRALVVKDMARYGFQDVSAHAVRAVGDTDGYESADKAIAAARSIAGWDAGRTTAAVAIVQDDATGRCSLVALDKSLLYDVEGTTYVVNEFQSAHPSVVAVLNGAGHELEHAGPVPAWM